MLFDMMREVISQTRMAWLCHKACVPPSGYAFACFGSRLPFQCQATAQTRCWLLYSLARPRSGLILTLVRGGVNCWPVTAPSHTDVAT
jgi:hypothetical protein